MSKAKQLNEKLRALLESPQYVEPIDGSKLVEDTKNWLLKIFNAWERDPTSNNVITLDQNISRFPIYKIERIKQRLTRYNYIFQVVDNKVTFFSRFVLVNNLKNLPKPSITQVLLWKDKDAEYGISSYKVTKNIIFKITGSLLSDKQQTRDGHNAWKYVAENLGFGENNHVGVYDSKDKKYIEFSDLFEFQGEVAKYYGKAEEFKRYQYVIYKD